MNRGSGCHSITEDFCSIAGYAISLEPFRDILVSGQTRQGSVGLTMSTWSTLRSRCQNRFVDMSSEEARLRSFLRWPYSNLIQPLDLAKAGMYFIGPGDLVQCAFCQGKLEGWSRGDNPLEEHRQHCFHDESKFKYKLNELLVDQI